MGFPRVNSHQIHLMCKHSPAVGAGSALALNYSLLGGEIFQSSIILQILQSGKSIIPNKAHLLFKVTVVFARALQYWLEHYSIC